ncbi:hypothetical protein ACOQFL_02525 [Actinopolyspora sp. H202]|uniref:hypothetical protein n=1 Tax=Actinopolyspora sp. H202 TaxID=1500456 RepID=UPI003EE4DA0F
MRPLDIYNTLPTETVYLRVRRSYSDPCGEWTTRRVESSAPLGSMHDPGSWWQLCFADDLPTPLLLTPGWAHHTRVQSPSPEERRYYRREQELHRYSPHRPV